MATEFDTEKFTKQVYKELRIFMETSFLVVQRDGTKTVIKADDFYIVANTGYTVVFRKMDKKGILSSVGFFADVERITPL